MRIISGKYKSQRLGQKKLNCRPTTDFAKEGLFNLINNSFCFEELVVLDLFSGSGNISFEFCSRGSKNVTCVENNLACLNFIKTTKNKLNLNQLSIIKSDVFQYLKKNKDKFDIIFVDPPYTFNKEKYKKIINTIIDKKFLNEKGNLIIEHSKYIKFEGAPSFFDTKKYGKVNFSFFK